MYTTHVTVAPLVGAWIEILIIGGLKKWRNVAPLVGAWIEIWTYRHWLCRNSVAPLVGAWIEITKGENDRGEDRGRSSRGSVD